ncbi:hypothetical protein C8R45DRAFT_1013950 [Mycena sanguinolenta]|nr:hypothetical protein C8R45DRAFT_1013950 [Mycena sanguinolenta]
MDAERGDVDSLDAPADANDPVERDVDSVDLEVDRVDVDAEGDVDNRAIPDCLAPEYEGEEGEEAEETAREVYAIPTTLSFADSLDIVDAAEDDKPTTADALLALERVRTRGGVNPLVLVLRALLAPVLVLVLGLEAAVGTGPLDEGTRVEVEGEEDEAFNDEPRALGITLLGARGRRLERGGGSGAGGGGIRYRIIVLSWFVNIKTKSSPVVFLGLSSPNSSRRLGSRSRRRQQQTANGSCPKSCSPDSQVWTGPRSG